MNKFIMQRSEGGELREHLHAIWYGFRMGIFQMFINHNTEGTACLWMMLVPFSQWR